MPHSNSNFLLAARCFGSALRHRLQRSRRVLNHWDLEIEKPLRGSIHLVRARSLRGAAILMQLVEQGNAVLVSAPASE